VVDGGFSVDRRTDDAMATRRWRYVIFPAHAGRLVVPPLTTTILTPAGERHMLRCASQTIVAAAGSQPAAAANESTPVAATAARVRGALNAWLAMRGLDAGVLLGETTDRGDALRAAFSLLDAAERDRIVWDAREVRRRVRDVVETCAPDGRMAQSHNHSP